MATERTLSDLLPTQHFMEFDSIVNPGKLVPIAVTEDNYINDGHHRYWKAYATEGPSAKIDTTVEALNGGTKPQGRKLRGIYITSNTQTTAANNFLQALRDKGFPHVEASCKITLE